MNPNDLAHSPACERNTPPLIEVFNNHLKAKKGSFLEIGFGTGQHAMAFSHAFGELNYFACDQTHYHPHLNQRLEVFGRPPNLNGPYFLQADDTQVTHNLPQDKFHSVFSANTLHIMSWPEALSLLPFMANLLNRRGQLFLYGPFKFSGKFTSESNARFDLSLRENAAHMGIREAEEITQILEKNDLHHHCTLEMPANNHVLIFEK